MHECPVFGNTLKRDWGSSRQASGAEQVHLLVGEDGQNVLGHLRDAVETRWFRTAADSPVVGRLSGSFW